MNELHIWLSFCKINLPISNTQDDELERTKRSPRDRQYDDDIEYDMGEPVQMGHFKFMDGFEDPE